MYTIVIWRRFWHAINKCHHHSYEYKLLIQNMNIAQNVEKILKSNVKWIFTIKYTFMLSKCYTHCSSVNEILSHFWWTALVKLNTFLSALAIGQIVTAGKGIV